MVIIVVVVTVHCKRDYD